MFERITPVITGIALLLTPIAGFAQESEASRAAIEESNLSIPQADIPAHILATLTAETDGAELIEREYNPEQDIYLFRTAGEDSQRLFLIIRENGDVRTRSREALEDAGPMLIDFMPEAAQSTIKDAVTETSGRVVEATEDLLNGKVKGYEAEVAYDRDQIRWFAFAPDGTTLEIRNETAWNPGDE